MFFTPKIATKSPSEKYPCRRFYGHVYVHCTIFQVTRKLKWFNHADTYYIDAGPRVDVSLIVMIVYALDELFSHGDNN